MNEKKRMHRERKYDFKLTGTRKYNESRSRKEDRKDRQEKGVRYIGIGNIKIEKLNILKIGKIAEKCLRE